MNKSTIITISIILFIVIIVAIIMMNNNKAKAVETTTTKKSSSGLGNLLNNGLNLGSLFGGSKSKPKDPASDGTLAGEGDGWINMNDFA